MDATPDLPIQPELPAQTAVKVLTANLRNVVSGVAEGEKLSGAQQRTILGYALTPESAFHSRGVSLLLRWAQGGRLNDDEVAHVRLVYPTFDPTAEPTAAQPLMPALATAPPAASAPAKSHRISREQYERWREVYSTEPRQLMRYIQRGREQEDECPLDEPEQMPAWWQRNMKHVVPPKILAAAAAAKAARLSQPPPREGPDGHLSAEKTEGAGADAPAAVAAAAQPSLAGFNLEGEAVAEGEAVRQARAVVGAYYAQLKAAAGRGDLDSVQLWQIRWEKAVESLRKQEKDDREWQKQLGLLISRADVETDVAAALTMLKAMREQMLATVESGLRRRFPSIDPALLAGVVEIVSEIRTREDDVFRELPALKSTVHVQERLAA